MRCALLLFRLSVLVDPTSPPADLPLTEESFLAAVGSEHLATQALAGELGEAEARRRQVGLLSDPRLEFEREEPDDLPRETIWGIAWRPPVDGRRRWAVQAAEAAVEAERDELEWSLMALRAAARTDFADWAEGQARWSLRSAYASRLHDLAERARLRADAGEEARLDAERLAIATRNARALATHDRAAMIEARARAAVWLTGSDEPADQATSLPELPPLAPPPASLDTTSRADVRAARARIDEAEARQRLARRALGAPEILIGWKDVAEVGADFAGPVFALSWSLPLLDGGRADRQAAEAAQATAHARSEWALRTARGEQEGLLARYVELRDAALDARAGLGDLADVERAAVAAFELGETDLTDLLDSLDAVLASRLAALDLYVAALESHRRLELAAGYSLIPGGSR